MTTDPIPRMPVEDPFAADIAALASIFPAAVADGRIRFDVLRQLLGGAVEDGDERYGLHWNGKRAARAFALTPATGTLRPDRDDGPDWDTTRNMVIEGDNLEVLKLLRRAYAGRVKLIYIDPPYNTGNDFVYPDDYRDTLGSYARLTGQRDEGGMALTSNGEGGGRFHTNWLNMMYPRLLLSKALLRDDGFFAVSIDDTEGASLRSILDEIFGEDCFLGTITWEKRTKSQNTETAKYMLQQKTETILFYSATVRKPEFALISKGRKAYPDHDDIGEFRRYRMEEMSAFGKRGRQSLIYPILGVSPRAGKQWQVGRDFIDGYLDRDDVELVAGWPTIKIRPGDEDEESFQPFWSHFFDKEAYGTAESGKMELGDVLGTRDHGFETVKPTALLRKLMFHAQERFGLEVGDDDIVLDYFAGSGTTGDAVMQQNLADGGRRRFILVQLPEPLSLTDKNQVATAKFCDRLGKPRTIAELTKERLRRAGAKLRAAHPDTAIDTGFRVYRLAPSNLKPWDPAPADLVAAVEAAVDNILPGRSEDDLLVELMLRTGVDPATPVETRIIAGVAVHAVDGGVLIACMAAIGANAEGLGEGIAAWHAELAPPRATAFHFRDSGFADAAAKANLAAILRQRVGTAGIARLSAL